MALLIIKVIHAFSSLLKAIQHILILPPSRKEGRKMACLGREIRSQSNHHTFKAMLQAVLHDNKELLQRRVVRIQSATKTQS